ncbi:MAG TPA: hypothetical protein VJ302_16775 [Blastocatellia bacterium]|nr:hypothetical protein [Blastocatellia bacterium]
MSLLARIDNFMPGDPILSSTMNQELDQIVNSLNGTLTNKNILVRFSNSSTPTLDVDQLGSGPIQRWKASGVSVATVANDGSLTTTQSLVSTLAPGGVAPISVTSTTVCANLNADMVDGLHGTDFIRKSDTSDQTLASDLIISKTTPELVLLHATGSKQVRINNDGTNWAFISDVAGATPLSIEVSTGIPTFNILPRATANPSTSTELARKAYVDQFLPLTGGTVTANLTVNGDVTVGDDLTVSDDASIGGALTVTGTVTAPGMSRVLYSSVVNAANSGSGETTLDSFTIPANTLSGNGDFITIDIGLSQVSSSSNTLRLKVGGNTILSPSNSSSVDLRITARVSRINSSSAAYVTNFLLPGLSGLAVTSSTGISIDWTSGVSVQITDQGTGSNQVFIESMVITYHRAP